MCNKVGFFLVMASCGIAWSQEVRIESLSVEGRITWTNSTLNGTCHVEWASSVDGPWHSSWEGLTGILVTSHIMEAQLPVFYRVVCEPAPVQKITNVSASTALDLILENQDQPDFVLLDIRTPGEYGSRHIRGAANLDFYSASFGTELAKLDRNRRYLIYCASGGRSGRAVETMRELEFMTVYNLTGGFGAFSVLPNAAPLLEP